MTCVNVIFLFFLFFFFSSRRRHTRYIGDWSSDVCSSDLLLGGGTTSYLTEKLQFEAQTAVYTRAFYSGTALDDTTFDIIIVPQPGLSLDRKSVV